MRIALIFQMPYADHPRGVGRMLQPHAQRAAAGLTHVAAGIHHVLDDAFLPKEVAK
jgi:hypothetical protein